MVSPMQDTSLLRISATASDPDRAKKFVQAVIEEYMAFSRRQSEEEAAQSMEYITQQLEVVLSNIDGKVTPAGRGGLLAAYGIAIKDSWNPRWTLTVHRTRATWDGESWVGRGWEEEELLPVAFTEPFQVLGKGDDY